jgi:hypothetical protein
VKSSDAGKSFGIPMNFSKLPNGALSGPEIDIRFHKPTMG